MCQQLDGAFLKCRAKCLQTIINTLVYFVYLKKKVSFWSWSKVFRSLQECTTLQRNSFLCAKICSTQQRRKFSAPNFNYIFIPTMLPLFFQYSKDKTSILHFSLCALFWNLPMQLFATYHTPSLGPFLLYLQPFSPCVVISYRREIGSFFPML